MTICITEGYVQLLARIFEETSCEHVLCGTFCNSIVDVTKQQLALAKLATSLADDV